MDGGATRIARGSSATPGVSRPISCSQNRDRTADRREPAVQRRNQMIPRLHLYPLFMLVVLAVVACGQRESKAPAEPSTAATDFERGPHRGRMLRDGSFALELQIFEDGVPPEFHVYLYR